MIIGLHGIVRPFTIKYKNYQELMLFSNFHELYVISFYGHVTTNTTAINILIVMAVVHFCFIIIYHIITYVCG